ncbi:WSC domain-containing protein [Psilocybe cubensis]|uniref:Peroxidase n=2 Tax=Psilocybe cubensis TaxID=181762 RepID=A0A8H8CN24_PSICU|nr:WSC domain-containing protein [Psilocybe cubensis]KAH9483912.1 WSC domain-containing protein [Psilocybe cubensis]
MRSHFASSICLLSLVSPLSFAYTWPSPQYDALEGLLFEGRRSDGSSLASLVHPCRKRGATLASVPAEWLRFAFHDMATHNVDDGTGGLDGSIVYELGRSENFGLGFNQTLSDFEAYPNKMVSRADVIAIGAIMAVNTCGGPIIPFRGGRIDSWVAGGTGTPEPQEDLATHTESFRKQGFNQAEMIKLVACGHTMGGVRSSDFPQLVAPDPNSVNPVIEDFDTTMDFDNKVVTEYLDGTTQNVLVISPNKTMVSDLRIFEADNNSTMHSLADSSVFQSECQSILARMLDTVPKGVTLTDEITLLPAKVTASQLTFERNQLVYKTSFRLLQPINATANANRNVTLFWCDRYGDNMNCTGKTNTALPVKTLVDDPNVSPITKSLGYYFLNYNFIVPIDSAASIAKFWFEVDEHDGSKVTTYNNGGNGYIIDQDQVLFVPMSSHVTVIPNTTFTQTYTNRVGDGYTRHYDLVVAVRDGTNPSRVYAEATDMTIQNFPFPLNMQLEFTANSSIPGQSGYSFYTATADSSGVQMSLDVHADAAGQTYTQTFMQTLVLDNAPYVKPGTVSVISTKTAAAGRLEVWGTLLLLSVVFMNFRGVALLDLVL